LNRVLEAHLSRDIPERSRIQETGSNLRRPSICLLALARPTRSPTSSSTRVQTCRGNERLPQPLIRGEAGSDDGDLLQSDPNPGCGARRCPRASLEIGEAAEPGKRGASVNRNEPTR